MSNLATEAHLLTKSGKLDLDATIDRAIENAAVASQNKLIDAGGEHVDLYLVEAIKDNFKATIKQVISRSERKADEKQNRMNDQWRANFQDALGGLRMVRNAIEELFGPLAGMESEEATLLRGPEPHCEAEAQVAALMRIKGAMT